VPLIYINMARSRFTYFREFSGGLLAGGFEPVCKPIFSEGVPPDFAFSLLDFDWDQFGPLMEEAMLRVPVLETTPLKTLLNGPESFTPDNAYILGEAPQLVSHFCACIGSPCLRQCVHGAQIGRLLRGGGDELLRHRLGGRGGEGAGAVDRRLDVLRRSVVGRHTAVRAVPLHGRLPQAKDCRDPGPALRDALAWA
jgi:hypothetical protein